MQSIHMSYTMVLYITDEHHWLTKIMILNNRNMQISVLEINWENMFPYWMSYQACLIVGFWDVGMCMQQLTCLKVCGVKHPYA